MISRPAYLSAEERREVTVETVIDLAAEQNPTDITTGAIAKRMGVTQGALFRHFPSQGRHSSGRHGMGIRALARTDRQGDFRCSSLRLTRWRLHSLRISSLSRSIPACPGCCLESCNAPSRL